MMLKVDGEEDEDVMVMEKEDVMVIEKEGLITKQNIC